MLNIITLTVVLIEGMVKKFFYIVMDRLLISLFFSHIYNAESLCHFSTELEDGHSYSYYMSFENIELATQSISYITGSMG